MVVNSLITLFQNHMDNIQHILHFKTLYAADVINFRTKSSNESVPQSVVSLIIKLVI